MSVHFILTTGASLNALPYGGFTVHVLAPIGGTRDEVRGVYRDASPLQHIDVDTAPFLILQGATATLALRTRG